MKLHFKDYKIIDPVLNTDGTIEAFVSVFGNIDAYGEVIDYGAFKDSLAIKLPKGVWSHNWDQPIAKTLEAREVPAGDPSLPEKIRNFGGLYIKGQFVLAVQKAAEVFNLIKEQVIDEFSIGYGEEESYDTKDGRHLKKLRLYEWSPVLVGANALTELVTIKSVVPYADHGIADENTAWDGPGETGACGDDLAKLKAICAWFDSENPDLKASYKLPHHQADGLKAVWKGVAAAMGALLGGRGGVDIPEADKQGVYNHLAKHYKEFGKEVPEMKEYSEEETKKIEDGVDLKEVKSPMCRMTNETKNECVSRKIPEIMKDDPSITQDQAIAMAESMCSKACSEKQMTIKTSRSNFETIRSAISSLTEVLNAGTEADNQEGPNGRTPLIIEGGSKKISVGLLNRAVRELLKIKKSQ